MQNAGIFINACITQRKAHGPSKTFNESEEEEEEMLESGQARTQRISLHVFWTATLLAPAPSQKALCGGIPGDGFGIWGRFWSHFVGNCFQKLTNLSRIDFEIPPRRALRGHRGLTAMESDRAPRRFHLNGRRCSMLTPLVFSILTVGVGRWTWSTPPRPLPRRRARRRE